MSYFTRDDMLSLDSSARKGLGEVVLYVVFTEVHGWGKYPAPCVSSFFTGGGPCVFLKCEDALNNVGSFAGACQGYIRQEIHRPGEKPVVRTFNPGFSFSEEDVVYSEEDIKNNY